MSNTKTNIRPSRRRFLALGVASAFLGTLPAALPAATTQEATRLVQDMVDYLDKSVIRVKNADAAAKAFEQAFRDYADVYFLGSYALGAAGRSISKSDKRRFADAFVGYLSRKYARRFTDFTGQQINVENAVKARRYVQVNAKASMASGQKVALEFHVSDKSGRHKVINIFIEGVNVLLAERAEVLALLDSHGGSISKLTRDLKTR